MLSTRTILEEIRGNDESFQLFCSIAAKGETQGGAENLRIAVLTDDTELSAKIFRHGEDEAKHGRLFRALLRKRGLEDVPVSEPCDYCGILESSGVGLAGGRLAEERPLDAEELIAYLAHSRVTEQRAAEEIALQKRVFAEDPEIGKALRMIAADEENHLDFCHEELIGFVARGHGPIVHRLLRMYALREIRTYRGVSLAVVREVAAILGWSAPKRRLIGMGIWAFYLVERAFTWRRMTVLRPPRRKNAMGKVTKRDWRTSVPMEEIDSPKRSRTRIRAKATGPRRRFLEYL